MDLVDLIDTANESVVLCFMFEQTSDVVPSGTTFDEEEPGPAVVGAFITGDDPVGGTFSGEGIDSSWASNP